MIVKFSDILKCYRQDTKNPLVMQRYTKGDYALRDLLFKYENDIKDIEFEDLDDNQIRSLLVKRIFKDENNLDMDAWNSFHNVDSLLLYFTSFLSWKSFEELEDGMFANE